MAHRTAIHVGHNALSFRGLMSNPELNKYNTRLVQEAWSPGLVGESQNKGRMNLSRSNGPQLKHVSEDSRCAPDNWVAIRPVQHFARSEGHYRARYPPRNLKNAASREGPRSAAAWVHTPIYDEPPFPIIPGTSAYEATKHLDSRGFGLGMYISTLDVLSYVYLGMGDRVGVADPWCQKRACQASPSSVSRYRDWLRLSKRREEGRPQAPKTVFQLFRNDGVVKERIACILREKSECYQAGDTGQKVLSRLYEEVQFEPGGLSRFKSMAEQDSRRYADEMRNF